MWLQILVIMITDLITQSKMDYEQEEFNARGYFFPESITQYEDKYKPLYNKFPIVLTAEQYELLSKML